MDTNRWLLAGTFVVALAALLVALAAKRELAELSENAD
jgi:hypothetical protein